MLNPGGGPIQYSETSPCPDPINPQLTLSVPALVLQSLSVEQRSRIAKIEIAFAQRVSRVLLRSYGEIADVLGREPRPSRKTEEPK